MNPQAQPPASSNPTNNPAGAAPPPTAPAPSSGAAAGAWPGGMAAIKQAFDGIMANPTPAIIYVGVSFVVGILGAATHVQSGSAARSGGSAFVGLIALLLIRAMVVYNLSVADKRPLGVSEFLAINLKQFFSLIIAAIAVLVILVIAAIPILIPWIWVIPWFAVTGYVLVDKDLSPFAAMGASRRMTEHHKGKVWGIIGWLVPVSIGAGIIGLIPYVSYITQPVLVVLEGATLAVLYRWLQKQPAQSSQPVPPAVAPAQ